MSRAETIKLGEGAGRLLDDETAMFAISSLEADCIETWKTSNPANQSVRDDAYRMVNCLKLFRLRLQSWRDAAEVDIHQAKETQKPSMNV